LTGALFIEQMINGLILGSMYALVASGVAMIYGTMRVLNFAHGEFYMLGGFFVFFLVVRYSIPPFVAIPLALVAVFLISVLVQRLTVHYLLKQEGAAFSTIAVTLGFSVLFQNTALHLRGEKFQSVPYYLNGMVTFGDIRLPLQRILIFGVAVVTMILMGLILKYTRFGMAVRATSQDADAAAVVGVPAHRIHTITFGLAAALGAIAAAMLAPLFAVNPWMGMPLLLKAFVVVILGGLGSFIGAIVAGLALGVVEAIAVTLTSSEWRDVVSFSLLILFIWLRPGGIFGSNEK
jgi:branched-chain amino acid transport system permease protein